MANSKKNLEKLHQIEKRLDDVEAKQVDMKAEIDFLKSSVSLLLDWFVKQKYKGHRVLLKKE